MSVTLADARTLLDRALTHISNPAILRLPEKEPTVEGLARAYLPRNIWTRWTCDGRLSRKLTGHVVRRLGHVTWCNLDLTDPGTAHATLVALALALGYDPGPLGLSVRWVTCNGGGWMLQANNPQHDPNYDASRFFTAAVTGHTSIPVRALEFAVQHVLAAKEAP